MNIYEDLETSLYNAIKPALPNGFTVIYGYENGPQPKFPFLQVDIISMNAVGRDYSGFLVDPTDSTTHYEQVYEALVRFYFFGRNDSSRTIGDVATEFEYSLNKGVVQESFEANNIGLMRKSAMLRSPKKYETEWVMCFQMDCTVSYAVSTKQSTQWIEEVRIDQTYTETSGEIVYQDRVTIGESTVTLP